MSLMSPAVQGDGDPAGSSPAIFPRESRTAGPVHGREGTGRDANSREQRCAEAGPVPPAWHARRLRLVATELHVTEVRVARDGRARTLRAGAPELGARRVSAGPGGGQRAPAQPPGAGGAGLRQVGVRLVRVRRASVRRAVRRSSRQPGGLRLTRRGRRLLTGFAMLVFVLAAMLIWTSVAGGAPAPRPGAPASSPYRGMTQIVVQPGQTLWSLAAAAEPSADPWSVIQQISAANALNGTRIQAGQLLWVPRG